ncbi:hypothetical protein CYPRO_0381 [Cyclonatronum proteinivorum]|uniref:Uncharacterized protein n=1 Tax=Cyclonatronum proteinivorum TaxID=1457365 RepID=A0A345UGR7_9BACT|nr:hypothetical protein CYPRO_0381 [Cyclonatronum proteinivorum]
MPGWALQAFGLEFGCVRIPTSEAATTRVRPYDTPGCGKCLKCRGQAFPACSFANGLACLRFVAQIRGEPAFAAFGGGAFAGGVVFDLIALYASYAEVGRFGVGEVEAAD